MQTHNHARGGVGSGQYSPMIYTICMYVYVTDISVVIYLYRRHGRSSCYIASVSGLHSFVQRPDATTLNKTSSREQRQLAFCTCMVSANESVVPF